jgi:hypothetical protein
MKSQLPKCYLNKFSHSVFVKINNLLINKQMVQGIFKQALRETSASNVIKLGCL